MKKALLGMAALLAMLAGASASNIPLQTGPNDPALDLYYNNQTIQAVNIGVNGMLASQVTSTPTTDTSADVLMSYIMPGGQLNAAGQALHIHAWGVNSADANAKTITFNYGSAACAQIVTGSGNKWVADFYILKTAAATQTFECHGQTATTVVASTQGTGTNTDSAATTITITGTAATAGTTTLSGAYIEQLK